MVCVCVGVYLSEGRQTQRLPQANKEMVPTSLLPPLLFRFLLALL